MKRITALIALSAVFALAGCGPSGEEELRQWMSELRATTKPRITPLKEPKEILQNPERSLLEARKSWHPPRP